MNRLGWGSSHLPFVVLYEKYTVSSPGLNVLDLVSVCWVLTMDSVWVPSSYQTVTVSRGSYSPPLFLSSISGLTQI